MQRADITVIYKDGMLSANFNPGGLFQKMGAIMLRKFIVIGAMFFSLSLVTSAASAVPYYYTDWTAWNPGSGTASGFITPSSGPNVNVQFDAITASGGNGSFLGVYNNSLWLPTATYVSAEVDNAPNFEALQLVGTSNMTYKVTLSEAIKDPIMAIATLGSRSDSATYVFDSPFTILSQGDSCCWGPGFLYDLGQTTDGYVLEGWEGSGIIQFIGTYSTFSWSVPDPEYWHGFTFGIRTTVALEPNPVPEPSTFLLLGGGLAGLAFVVRRKKTS